MTITLSFGSWIVPAAITIIAGTFFSVVAYRDRDSTGFFAGFNTMFTAAITLGIVATAWVTYGVTAFFGK